MLWVEPIANYKAIVCLRNDKMVMIDLRTLSLEKTLDVAPCRMLKTLSPSKETYGVITATEVGCLRKNRLVEMNKVQTKLLTDMEVCVDGVVGVTQEGFILFLPC